jgi:hypothetical protein
LSIRDVGPAPEAVRVIGERHDGLPDGAHTGGAWELGGEIWKPLDGRPYPNCEFHYATDEEEMLKELSGLPLFPENWRIEERNGRRFVVRTKGLVLGSKDFPHSYLTHEHMETIEAGVRAANERGWEINDEIGIAFDPESYDLYVYDLSACQRMTGKAAFAADDTSRLLKFFDQVGWENLAKLRRNGQTQLQNQFIEFRFKYRHVYASFNRPFSLMWASLPGEIELVHEDRANWSEMIPHTWILSAEPLPEDKLKSYELKWAWSPIEHQEG